MCFPDFLINFTFRHFLFSGLFHVFCFFFFFVVNVLGPVGQAQTFEYLNL